MNISKVFREGTLKGLKWWPKLNHLIRHYIFLLLEWQSRRRTKNCWATSIRQRRMSSHSTNLQTTSRYCSLNLIRDPLFVFVWSGTSLRLPKSVCPLVCPWVSLLVGPSRSVIIFLKGEKFHFHAPIATHHHHRRLCVSSSSCQRPMNYKSLNKSLHVITNTTTTQPSN